MLLFYIFLNTKFLVGNTQDITSDVILIIIVVVIYMMFVKYVKKLVLEDLYSYLFSLCLISSLTKKKYNHDWLSLGLFVLILSLAFGFVHVLRGGDWSHIWVYALSGTIFSLLLFSKDIKKCMIYHALTNAFPIFNHCNDYADK